MRTSIELGIGVIGLLAFLACIGLAQEHAPKDLFFERRVAPILKQSCLPCHNRDKAKGGLDLSTRTTLLEGGDKGPAIVPGESKNSRLMHMIQGPNPKMPRQGDPLTADQVN